MPIGQVGRRTVGPLPTSTPATLLDYLVSISKASWYARFVAGYQMLANSDGSGGAVATGGSVGQWATNEAVSWTAKFIQSTSASRPLYSDSLSGIGPTISGNGTSWQMLLDSTTVLNRDYTVLVSADVINAASYVWSQNAAQFCWNPQPSNNPDIYWQGAVANGVGLDKAEWSTATATTTTAYRRYRRVAVSTGTGTAHYNNAFRILGSAASASLIREVIFCPKLSSLECARAVLYLP